MCRIYVCIYIHIHMEQLVVTAFHARSTGRKAAPGFFSIKPPVVLLQPPTLTPLGATPQDVRDRVCKVDSTLGNMAQCRHRCKPFQFRHFA